MIKRAFLVLVVFLSGCSSTKLIDTWREPDYKGEPFNHLLVIGVSDEIANRRIFEDSFVAQLTARGITAEVSYRLFPESGKIEQEQLAERIDQDKFTGILMSRVVEVKKENQVIYTPPAPRGFYGYYNTIWLPSRAEVREYQWVVVETTLFETATLQPVWSVMTETFEPHDLRKVVPEFAKVIVDALQEQQLL